MLPKQNRAQSLPVCGGHDTFGSRISKKPLSSLKYRTKQTRPPLGKRVIKEVQLGVGDSGDGTEGCSDETVFGDFEAGALSSYPVAQFQDHWLYCVRLMNVLAKIRCSQAQHNGDVVGPLLKSFPTGEFCAFMSYALRFLMKLLETRSAASGEYGVSTVFNDISEAYMMSISKHGFPPSPDDVSSSTARRRTSPPLTKRKEQTLRRLDLDEAAKRHSTSADGKPLSEAKLLAKYGSRKIHLGGQMAVTQDMDPEDACEECKSLKPSRLCIMVQRDRFWKRGQCVECTEGRKAGRD